MRVEKRTLLPKRRFSEFQHAPGWNAVNGDEVFDLIDQRPAPPGLPILAITQEHGAVPRDYIDYNISVTDASIASYKEVQPGDFIISLRSFQGGIEYSRFHGVCSPAYLILRRKGVGVDDFFRYLFKSDRFILQLTRNIEGIRDGKMISYKQFSEQLLPVPVADEQQKIAACFTSLDQLIAAEARKLESLRAHKKGLMQRLFLRDGETRPRLRFPEFREAKEWEIVPLGEIAEIKLGKMLDGMKHRTGHLLPYLNNLAVRWNEVDTSNLPHMYFDDDELDRFGLKANDVLVCEGGEPGRAAVWDGHMPELKFQKAIHRVRFNVPFESHLLVAYLEAIAGTAEFERLFTGGGIKHLTRETFALLPIPMMPLVEQQRIASCLSSLDGLIAGQSRQLGELRTHKKGLMQQLFPSAEGV